MSGTARPGFDTVVFDLDGTLIDGSEDIADALEKAVNQHASGTVTVQQVRDALGGGPRNLVEKCLHAAGIDVTAEQFEQVLTDYSRNYIAAPANKIVLLDSSASVLRVLADHDVTLGICTNKRTAIAEEVLEKLGVRDCFGSVVGSDAATRPKPDPAHLLDTTAGLNKAPNDVLYVGDTTIDRTTAVAAGIAYAHVSWGEAGVDSDFPLASFDELIPLMLER